MSVKKWNFYYEEKKNIFTKRHLIDTAVLWIAIGLLWYSFVSILGEHFWQLVDFEWWVIILFAVCLWIPNRGVVTLAAIGIPIVYIVAHLEELPGGVLAVAYRYLYYFNPYQGTNLYVPYGDSDYIPITMTAGFMLLWMAIWGVSKLFKKPVLLVLFPLCAVFMEFMVGTSPKDNGMFCLFVAAFLLMVQKDCSLVKKVTVAALAAISLLLAGNLFEENIEMLSQGPDVAFELVKNFEIPAFRIADLLKLDFVSKNEQVSNSRPIYTGEKMFEIRTEEPISTSIYLRGFCGTNYDNGNWQWDISAFQQACEIAGYSEEETAKIIAENPYDLLKQTGHFYPLKNEYKITYLKSKGDTAYFPYIFNVTGRGESCQFSGDYISKKGLRETTLRATGSVTGDLWDLSYYTEYAKDTENYKVMVWYDSVAEAYGKSVTDMSCIREAAEEINAIAIQFGVENVYRMYAARLVRAYLAEMLSYSLTLDRLPNKTDPVEYALTTGYKGYCMHYASAATLILKEMGIPARYVSGYIVRPVDFRPDNGGYVAEVEDYNSHAWVEIYLDHIGWVPIEVTEGYEDASGELPTKENSQNTGINQPTPTEGTSELPSETELPSESETPSETEAPSQPEPPSESESQSASESQSPSESQQESETQSDPQGGGGTQGGGQINRGEVVKVLISIFGIAVLLLAVVYLAKTFRKQYDGLLKQEIEKKLTRRAVKRINRRIYRKLRLTVPLQGEWTDEGYEKLLIEHYPKVSPADWIRYMEIVKKAHYSLETVTVEEMMHCYQCYKERGKL